MFPVVKREKFAKTKVSILKLMFFTVKSYQRVAVHLQQFLNDYLKSSKILKTDKVRCFLLLVKGLSVNKQTNKTFDRGSEGRSVLL